MQRQIVGLTGYRPDIDGLRALAILPVVLFHAKVQGFSGGFIGVDVFFVISGYLITSIIHDELNRGDFSIVRFYERRARRILPALFLVLICSFILAALVLFPKQYLAFSRSLISAAAFVSSITFYSESGYFDLDAEMKPLLHTWSLSVEELYYVLFPILMLGLYRFAGGRYWQVLLVLAIASLMGATVALLADAKSNAAFFLPHLRAWELLIGALLAVTHLPAVNRLVARHALSLLGLAMILVPVFVYSDATTFPGLAAVPPCIGAALLIYTGRHGASLGGSVLSNPVLVYFGRISYALYLWHWPLLVFARFHWDRELSASETASVIVLSIVLATISTFFVEGLFRGPKSKLSGRQILTFSVVGTVLLIAIGVHGDLTKGWPGRYPTDYQNIFGAARDKDPRQRECLFVRPDPQGCVYGNQAAAPTVALWGDSHAAMYADLMGNLAKERGLAVAVYTFPSCPPVKNWAIPTQSWRAGCLQFQDTVFKELLASKTIKLIVMGAANGYPISSSETGFSKALESTIAALTQAGKKLAVIYPVPHYGQDVPTKLVRLATQHRLPKALSLPRQKFDSASRTATEFLDGLAAKFDLHKVQPDTLLCSGGQCYVYRDGQVYYSDGDHLSLAGANQLKPIFRPLIER